MAKISTKYSVSAKGEFAIRDGAVGVIDVDTGEFFDFAELLKDFDGRDVAISCSYAEDMSNE